MQVLTLKLHDASALRTKSYTFAVKKDFKPNTWYQLMMRFEYSKLKFEQWKHTYVLNVNISVNCEVIGKFNPINIYPYQRSFRLLNYVVLGASLKTNSRTIEADKTFPVRTCYLCIKFGEIEQDSRQNFEKSLFPKSNTRQN